MVRSLVFTPEQLPASPVLSTLIRKKLALSAKPDGLLLFDPAVIQPPSAEGISPDALIICFPGIANFFDQARVPAGLMLARIISELLVACPLTTIKPPLGK